MVGWWRGGEGAIYSRMARRSSVHDVWGLGQWDPGISGVVGRGGRYRWEYGVRYGTFSSLFFPLFFISFLA